MKTLYAFLFSPYVLHHSNYTWRSVQVAKLLIMQFSPTSCHFTSIRSKYVLSSTPCSQISSVCVLPLMSETKVHTYTKLHGQF
jgi:hypothetical protein